MRYDPVVMYAKKIMCTGFFAILLLLLCTLPVLTYSPEATDMYAQGNMLMKNIQGMP